MVGGAALLHLGGRAGTQKPLGTHFGQQSPGAWCALKLAAQSGVPQYAPLHSEGAFSLGATCSSYQPCISAGSYVGATSAPNSQTGQQESSCFTFPGGGQLSSPQTVPLHTTGSGASDLSPVTLRLWAPAASRRARVATPRMARVK